MGDIKQKFIDILFESEPDEIEASAPLKDVKEKEESVTAKKEPSKVPNAKDILYGNGGNEKSSTFIDILEVPRKPKTVEEVDETYEMRENVSPIFGPIVQKEKKKKVANEKDIQKAVSNSSSSEYTNIVISPIYGYDINKANDTRKNVFEKSIKDEKEEVVDVNDDIFYEDEEPPFEISEEMNEAIKEAVQEAVVELTPTNESLDNQIDSSSGSFDSDANEAIKTDINNNDGQENEEDIVESFDEIINAYEDQDDRVADANDDTPTFDDIDDSNTHEEDNESIEYDEYEDFQTSDSQAEDVTNNEIEADSFINEEVIDNKEDIQDQHKDVEQKANRSIYDTTPIQLFDFDDIVEKESDTKDLFDELIGDDD